MCSGLSSDAFSSMWATFIATNFASDLQAAKAFGVDPRTIRHWMNGRNAPGGFAVARAVTSYGFLREDSDASR